MRTDLSTGWTFERIRAGRHWTRCTDAVPGITVDLPHTWNERDTFQEGVTYYRGWGSYRRSFIPPPESDPALRWHLCSEGFYGTGDIWLNGRKVSDFDGQYLGFREDVTEFLRREQPNCLAIRLNNRYRRNVLPGIRDPDFLLYGGLAGRAWLEGLPTTHVVRETFWTFGQWNASDGGIVHCRFTVANTGGCPVGLSARAVLRDAAENTLAAETVAVSIPAGTTQNREVEIRLPSARPWSPESPNLYCLGLTLLADGVERDTVTRRIGFRTAEFRPGAGFFLNGNRIHLHGCNRHESMPGFGQALPVSLHREDAARIRRLGLNFVRLSHYPQHPAFLDACDEQGLMVYAEIATWKSVRGYGRWLKAACRQMRDMILRDRSHPSVILWGMGNEERSRRAFRKLQSVARELDPERPTIYAENHLHRAVRRGTTGIPDVWGSNYELDSRAGGAAASRLNVALVSEMSNYPPGRRGELQHELEQVALVEADLKRLGNSPVLAGFALWCWNDYATLRKARYFRHCGLVDAWRLPKPAAWLLEAMYAGQPVVRLAGDWSLRRGDCEREVHVFTNCPAVTLAVEGRTVIELRGGPHLVARLPYRPAPLVAVASGPSGPAQAVLLPHDSASRLTIEPERLQACASDRDTVGFLLRAEDMSGNVAVDWSGPVSVTVDGPARLRAYTPRDEVLVSGGIGRGFVTGTGTPGTVTLTAAHPVLGRGTSAVTFAR